mgnify:CR=1 FL=1|jgi:hypothetical protein
MRNKPRKAEFCCLISRRRLRLSHELFLALQTVDTIHSKVTTFQVFPASLQAPLASWAKRLFHPKRRLCQHRRRPLNTRELRGASLIRLGEYTCVCGHPFHR